MIKELYPIVYGKSTTPKFKLLGKEFANRIVTKVVKGILVSWVSFGHEININQQGKWQSIGYFDCKKASLLGTYTVEVKKD